MLGVSRPTLVQIEADKRKVKAEEIKKFSEIFNISTDYLLGIDTSEEVHIDEKQITKFKHLLLYILSKVGAKYNVGKVVLYKLLYFSEFDFYEQYQKKLTGYPFIKLPL
jgi:transcriptional regulator with XRE-family HTH domain